MRPKTLGRYEILDELGRGAMGVVYKARDPAIGRVVAIKTIGSGLSPAEFEAFEKRFEREAKSAGRLNHPSIVTIYDVGKSEDTAYIAMEFLEGRSLREVLDSGVVLAPSTIAVMVAQIADGLAFAHQHDVVHRDIKPSNIMVLDSGSVKIMDFGIAKLPSGSRTVAGPIFGSPKYISPERVVGRDVDARSDIFSLGAVLYELLTGVPPFNGTDLDEILHHVINAKPVPPSARNRRLPGAFDIIVERALAKHPNDRYQTAKEMAVDLRKLAQEPDAPVAAPSAIASQRRSPSGSGQATVIVGASPADDTVLIGSRDEVIATALAASKADSDNRTWLRHRGVWYGIAAAVVVGAVGGVVVLRSSHNATAETAPSAANRPAMVADAAPTKPAGTTMAAFPLVVDPAPVASAPPTSIDAVRPAASTEMPAHGEVAPVASGMIAAADKAATPKPLAHVAIAVSPWGEVYVDGHKRGVSPPLTDLRLTPGKHTIEIRNSTFEPHSETIELKPDASLRIKHKFQ
ncbi:MAG TPA: protein kinase [Casimicrobiaceae bacterium]|nr:protein kinase [Casimicrobiaceae bacterium]